MGIMPEGDTVWRTARTLRLALAGATLTHADLRVPRHATADLTGTVVADVVSRGKHLLVRVSSGKTLHTHLGMDGSWRVHRARGALRRPAVPGPAGWRVRAVLANAQWVAVGTDLSRVDLVPTSGEAALVGHLGPDLLGPDWDADEVVRRIGRTPDRPIAEALLDQRCLAGIGNLYQAETLYLRGVHPHTPVCAAGDLRRMVELARQLLTANLDHPEQATTGRLRHGERHWVYGRVGLPCRRCGTAIATGTIGPATRERVAFWCPVCQPNAER